MLDDKEGRIRAIGVWHGTRAADATQRSVPRRRWGDQEIGHQAAKLEGDKRQKAQALEGFRFWPTTLSNWSVANVCFSGALYFYRTVVFTILLDLP